MIVCHCAVVRCDDVREAVEKGAGSLARVCAATGAGRDCGGCVFTLRRVLCEHEQNISAASVVEVEGAAS